MWRTLLAGLLAVSTCWAQEPIAALAPARELTAAHAAEEDPQSVEIPAGTRIPLTLENPISVKSARAGFAVRASTAFPVTVGTQVVIPVGTYLDGAIDKVTKGSGGQHDLTIHFTRLLYANGYTVNIDGTNVAANFKAPVPARSEAPQFADAASDGATESSVPATGFALAAQQSPTLPPLKNPGPSVGEAAGIGVGALAAVLVTVMLLGRRQTGGNAILHDTGWQFDIVLKKSCLD